MLQIWVGGRGGKIVIPMPEALSFAESRRQKALCLRLLLDALRANQGQSIMEPQREILAKQVLNTKCLEFNRT
jgi:hypothetical protein